MPSPTREPSRAGPVFAYRPALDGLRAFAVLGVLLFHGGVAWLPGGFLGVDAFFVLSGFLITSLLLAERARTGRIRLGAFWLRRARRLLPALLLLLVAVVIAFRRVLAPVEVALLRGDALSALGYVANWRMIYRGDDYFAQTSAPSPLQHTWSLGIEEQFYLVWPLVVTGLFALALRRASGPHQLRRTSAALAALCLAGAAGSAIAAALLFRPQDANRAYFGTDTRAQALLVGCALAALFAAFSRAAATEPTNRTVAGEPTNRTAAAEPTNRPAAAEPKASSGRPWLRRGVAAAGIGGVLVAGWLWSHLSGTGAALFRGGLTLDALAVAAVIAYAVTSPLGPVGRVLSLAPLVWLGRISYGVYLWHWPLFALLTADRAGVRGIGLLSLRLAVTLAVATVSYVVLEEPVRRGRAPWPLRTAPVAGALARARATAAGITGVRVGRPAQRPGAAAWARLRPLGIAATSLGLVGVTGFVVVAATAAPSAEPADPVYALPAAGPTATAPAPTAPIARAGRRPGAAPRIAFLGDSVAWTLGTYLPPHPGLDVTVRAIQGCGIARLPDLLQLGTGGTNYPGCTTWDARWRRDVNRDDPDVAVILLDRWELMDRRIGDGYHHVGEPIYDFYLAHELELAVGVAGARGAHVVLLTAPYTHRAERPDGGLYDEDRPERVDAWNRLLYAAAASNPRQVSVIDLNHRVCPQGAFTWRIGDLRIRSDGLHFTPEGVRQWIAPWLLPQLAALALGATPAPTPTPALTPAPTLTRAGR